jgi:hypothetical protein
MEQILPGVSTIITRDGGNDILKILNLNENNDGGDSE